MNSDKEHEIFEGYGWQYNYVKRFWMAPDGYVIELDDLMKAADEYGPNIEMALINVAAQHGKPQT
jgi:hypothetical protein